MAGFNVRSVLVTGANRGIGLGLVKQFLGKSNPPEWVFATCRDPEAERVQELKTLASRHPNLAIVALATRVEEHLKGSGLNLLINNAGVVKLSTLESETPENMSLVYTTNVTGPLLVSQAPLTVDMSVRGILNVLPTLSKKENGAFVSWEGKVLPW
ncbi:hypothetical protein KIL84_005097 [Mauremys mutica]|uniref:Uncharacterized protein n=1 Tax=Mauremys mutica TaxID=74926 RepID=A0A9D3XKT5_9SAUR|nr:hypothetical protein KIL84_005097 [Mauremys mutica]